MKFLKVAKKISCICCGIGFLLSLLGLMLGLGSIGASDFSGLGVIFILPSIVALIIISLDYLIASDKFKKGLIYSIISSLLKIGSIIYVSPLVIYDIKYEMKYGTSNISSDIIIIVSFIIITLPSILNVIKLLILKKNSTEELH